MDFFYAAFFTILIESIILILILKKEDFLVLRTVFCANVLSLPFVWFFFPSMSWSYNMQIFSSELFAFFAEAFVYSIFLKKPLRDGFLISFAANVSSFLFGLLLV